MDEYEIIKKEGDAETAKEKLSRKSKIILAIICIVTIGSCISGRNAKKFNFSLNNEKEKTEESIKSLLPSNENYSAVLHIEGVIAEGKDYNQKWINTAIDILSKDKNCQNIILYIDSPGGAVYNSDETYLKLLEYKQKTGKTVYAYFASLAASGGYYIGCAADKISANRNCLTGSIGVIAGQSLDLTELMKTYGIKMTTIHSGKNKIMGAINEPFSEEQQQIMQTISDECYAQFTGIVAESRGMELSKVESLADGRIYTAKQALENNLIDNICSYEDCLKDAGNYKAVDLKYHREFAFNDFIDGIATGKIKFGQGGLPGIVEEKAASTVPFPAYYFEF